MADEGLSPGSFMPNCSASCVSMHCQHAAHASQHHMLCLIILINFLGHRHHCQHAGRASQHHMPCSIILNIS